MKEVKPTPLSPSDMQKLSILKQIKNRGGKKKWKEHMSNLGKLAAKKRWGT